MMCSVMSSGMSWSTGPSVFGAPHEAEVDGVLVGIPLRICYDALPPGPGDHEARRVVPEVQHHHEADAE